MKTRLHVGVLDVVRELALDLLVLLVAVGSDALVAFLPILLTQGVGVEAQVGLSRCGTHVGPFAFAGYQGPTLMRKMRKYFG